MNGTSSKTTFFSFGSGDSFISKCYEGLRYRHLPPSLHDLFNGGNIVDVHWASLSPVPESWVLSFKDLNGNHNLAWGSSTPARLTAILTRLTPTPHCRAFLGTSSSFIVWSPSLVRWSNLPLSLEDSLQSWLTPAGWKAGPPRMVTWGEHDAFFAMSEYGDVAYRLGDGKDGEWETWRETVEEWKGEGGFAWSELAYISIDPTTADQFIAIRNDGTWSGAIDDVNEEALSSFADNFFRLATSRQKGIPSSNHTNGHHQQHNRVEKVTEMPPDPATQAQYEKWATNTARVLASALAANLGSPARRAPRKLQIRSLSGASIPSSTNSIPQPSQLTAFPYLPPATTVCALPLCMTQKAEAASLRACKHDVERLLRASGLYSFEWLRQERIRWHPDRFGRLCEESWREEGKRLAEEMFKIIDILIGEVEKTNE